MEHLLLTLVVVEEELQAVLVQCLELVLQVEEMVDLHHQDKQLPLMPTVDMVVEE
jgi:hypothetical protein